MMVYKRAAPLVNLRNQHFQNAGRGPGTGPSGPHFENVDFEGKGLKAATPPPQDWWPNLGPKASFDSPKFATPDLNWELQNSWAGP